MSVDACVCQSYICRLYKESDACRMEADYSFQLKKNIICCKAEEHYTPDGWLGMLLGSRLWCVQTYLANPPSHPCTSHD
jgi:hypothetical protein|eukprot:COSAG06_NODE_3754_length_4944_cov_10.989267_4_plen_79_part_00